MSPKFDNLCRIQPVAADEAGGWRLLRQVVSMFGEARVAGSLHAPSAAPHSRVAASVACTRAVAAIADRPVEEVVGRRVVEAAPAPVQFVAPLPECCGGIPICVDT